MIFSSYLFVFAFLPVTLIIYFLLSHIDSIVPQHLFLVAASLFFYAYFNPPYLFLILTSIFFNFLLGYLITHSRSTVFRKIFFVCGILFNIFLLGFFKYYDFFIETVNAIFHSSFSLLHILLPLGISFFTFQQLSFLVSIYKREESMPDILSYSLFVTFFPQLVAGPIVLFSEMNPQFKDVTRRNFKWDNFTPGVYLFIMGMSKKLLIADTVSFLVDTGYNVENIGFISSWITALAYTVQIYFDFSGYNDMALGLGRMFNFDLPSNFNSPYQSKSITEFWRRWHITLGRALTTYIYIPLGGNRKGITRTCMNLMMVFIISGIWHGAAWTFILWGILNGVIVVAERLCGFASSTFSSKYSAFLHQLLTFITVNLLWVFFRSETIGSALNMIGAMFNPFDLQLAALIPSVGDRRLVILNTIYGMLALIIGLFLCFKSKNIQSTYEADILKKHSVVKLSFLLLLCFICMSRVSPFIYFNF